VNPADAVASRRARRLVRGIAVGLILVGVLAAASWGLIWLSNGRFGIRLTGLPPALSNIVLGIACLLALKQGKRAQVASRLLALLDLGMMGVWLGVEASIPYEWTPEQWYRSAPDVGFSTAALAACLLLRGSSRIGTLLIQTVCAVVLATRTVEMVGRAFGVVSMYSLGSLGPAPSSVVTLISLAALSLAVLSMPPLRGPMAVVLSPRMGGVASRWAAVLLLALPLIGRSVMVVLREGLISGETALALASSLNILAAAGLVLWLGRKLNWGDEELERSRMGLARHRDWLAQVIDQLPEGILLVDAEGRLTIFNGTVRRLLPELDHRLRLQKVFADRPDELGHLVEPLERCSRDNVQLVGLEATITPPTGEKIPLLVGMAPLPDVSGGLGAVVVMQDVTRYKAYEQAREEWLAVVAHDLRQPISVISLAAQQLQRGTSEPTRSLQLIARIRSLAVDLARMVDDLLDASRIEAHRMELHPTPTELTSRLRELVQAMEDIIPLHRVELQLPSQPLWVSADVPRLRQILGNLLSNAEKYGDADTPITVKLEQRGSEAVVAVANCGEPLPQQELDRLFRRFVRADTPATARNQGVGLGLYITRGLVEAHGGKTWAATEGRWMRVSFSMPLIDPPGQRTPVEALH